MLSAKDALLKLQEGNKRFAAGSATFASRISEARRAELLSGQSPFAIILGCSDSRVPAEIVFDQGVGELFVIRVAGNVVAPSQVGSVEFAAENFGTRLVVVLGHSQCGAVSATLQQLEQPSKLRSPNLRSIVEFITPSVVSLVEDTDRSMMSKERLLHKAVRANVRASAQHLRNGSTVLQRLTRDEGLLIVGAEYSLESGLVDFFDGVEALS